MRLSQVFKDNKTLCLDMGDGATLNLVYNPQKMTPKMLMQVGNLANISFEPTKVATKDVETIGVVSEILIDFVRQVIVSWDLNYDDDTPIPLTAEALADVPLPILLFVFSELKLDSSPNPTKSSNSAAVSSLAD